MISAAVVLLGLFIIGSSICRVDALRFGKHRTLVVLAHLAIPLWAGLRIAEVLYGMPHSAVDVLGLGAVAAHMAMGAARWRDGAPADLLVRR